MSTWKRTPVAGTHRTVSGDLGSKFFFFRKFLGKLKRSVVRRTKSAIVFELNDAA